MRIQHSPASVRPVYSGQLAQITGLLVVVIAIMLVLALAGQARPFTASPQRTPDRNAFLAFKEAQADARAVVVAAHQPDPVTSADLLALKEAQADARAVVIPVHQPDPVTSADLLALKEAQADAREYSVRALVTDTRPQVRALRAAPRQHKP